MAEIFFIFLDYKSWIFEYFFPSSRHDMWAFLDNNLSVCFDQIQYRIMVVTEVINRQSPHPEALQLLFQWLYFFTKA